MLPEEHTTHPVTGGTDVTSSCPPFHSRSTEYKLQNRITKFHPMDHKSAPGYPWQPNSKIRAKQKFPLYSTMKNHHLCTLYFGNITCILQLHPVGLIQLGTNQEIQILTAVVIIPSTTSAKHSIDHLDSAIFSHQCGSEPQLTVCLNSYKQQQPLSVTIKLNNHSEVTEPVNTRRNLLAGMVWTSTYQNSTPTATKLKSSM